MKELGKRLRHQYAVTADGPADEPYRGVLTPGIPIIRSIDQHIGVKAEAQARAYELSGSWIPSTSS